MRHFLTLNLPQNLYYLCDELWIFNYRIEQLLFCITGKESWTSALCNSGKPANQPNFKCIFFQCWNDVFEENLGCQGVTVVHDGLPIVPVPAVHLHTATASLQCSVCMQQNITKKEISGSDYRFVWIISIKLNAHINMWTVAKTANN